MVIMLKEAGLEVYSKWFAHMLILLIQATLCEHSIVKSKNEVGKSQLSSTSAQQPLQCFCQTQTTRVELTQS